ncbi:MAG: hypothetical protein WCR42_10270 [bacterium]
MKLFIDIDGVLLTTKLTKPAENLREFIDYILENFDCYWLTTHCKGDTKPTIEYLAMFLDDEIVNRLRQISPTNWTTLKTEVFDFSSNFLWLDDYPLQAEIAVLKENNASKSLIIVDLNQKDELKRVIEFLNKNSG